MTFKDEITFDKGVQTKDVLANIQGPEQGRSKGAPTSESLYVFSDFMDVTVYSSVAFAHFASPAGVINGTIDEFVEVVVEWWDGATLASGVETFSDVPIGIDNYRWHVPDDGLSDMSVFAHLPVRGPIVRAFWFWCGSTTMPLAIQTWAYGSLRELDKPRIGSNVGPTTAMKNWAGGADASLLTFSQSIAAGATVEVASYAGTGRAVLTGNIDGGTGTVTVRYISGDIVPTSAVVAVLPLSTTSTATTLNVPRGSMWFEFKNTGGSAATINASLIVEEV